MRIRKLLLIHMCCLLAALAVWGQAANSQAVNSHAQPGILGRYDPHTRVFRPLPQPDVTAEPLALTTFTGTIDVSFNITVKSTGITNVNCYVIVSLGDAASTGNLRSIGEIGIVAATGSGGTRTCTVSIPYSWSLATQASDTMSTSYIVTNLFLLGGAAPPERSSVLVPLDTRKVPANGTTTNLSANVTI
jgi:hypothetical protein